MTVAQKQLSDEQQLVRKIISAVIKCDAYQQCTKDCEPDGQFYQDVGDHDIECDQCCVVCELICKWQELYK